MSFTTINLDNITTGNSAYLAFDLVNGFRLFAEVEDSGVVFLHDITEVPPEASLELMTTTAIVEGSLLRDVGLSGNFIDLNTSVGQIVRIDTDWFNVSSFIDDNTLVLDRTKSFNSVVSFAGTTVTTAGLNELVDDNRVLFKSSSTLPGTLSLAGIYYVVNADSSGFSVALTEGGTAIDVSGSYIGQPTVYKVHTVHTTNYNPDHLRDTILGEITNTAGVYSLLPFFTVNDSNVTPITLVASLPVSGEYDGQVVINASDNNVYTWNGVSWTTTTSNTARTVTLTTSTQAFSYTSNGDTPDPTSATLTATAFNMEGTVYYQFLVDGVSVQNTTSNTYAYTPRADLVDMPDVLEVRVREATDDSDVLASDQITCFGVAPGSDAITILLSNEAHTLPADDDGANPVLTASGTTIRAYKGNTLLAYDATLSADPSFKVAIFDEENVTAGAVSGAGTTATIADLSGMTASRGFIVYDITILSEASETIYQKVQSFAKSLAGIPGAGGADAVTVQLTANDYSIIYDETEANPVPSSITLVAQSQNISTPYYTFRLGTSSGTILQASSVDDDLPISMPAGFFTPSVTYWVGVSETDGGSIVAYDTISVYAVRSSADGENAYTAILSNDAHTLPASSAGSVTSYAGSGTIIEAYLGATELAYTTGTPGAGEFSVSASGTDITPGSISASGDKALVADHSSMIEDAAKITYTINLEDLVTISKVQSFSKARAGAAGSLGTGAAVVKLDIGSYAIVYDSAGSNPSPSGTVALTATAQNIDDPWFKFTATPTLGGFDEATFTDGSGSTDTKTFTVPASYFATPYKFRVDVSDGDQAGLAFDTISVYAVRPGIDAIIGFLTNEAHTVATAFDGTGASYSTAGGTFTVFDGVTNVTSSSTFAISGGTDAGSTWTKTQNGLTFTINETTGVYSLSGGAWTSDSESFTATATYDGVTISKTYTISKSKAGTPSTVYYVNSSSDVVKRNLDKSLTPSSITFTSFSVVGNSTPAAYSGRFKVYRNGVLVYTSASNQSSYVYTPATPETLTDIVVELYAAGGTSTLLDTESIQLVQDGGNAITVSVDNDNITYSGPVSGFSGINFGTATSTIKVYLGSTQLSYAGSGPNTFSCTNSSTGVSVATGSGSGTSFVVPVPTAMSNINAYTDVVVTIRDEAANVTSQTVRITYSLARAGNDSTAYWVVSSADVVKKSDGNVLTPGSVTFTGYRAVGNGTPALYAGRFRVSRNGVVVYTSASNESSYIYTPATPASLTDIKVEMFLAGGTSTKVDEELIPIVVDGSAAYTVSVDNDSKTFPAQASGFSGITFGSTTSTIRVYRGSTQLNYNTSGANTFSCTIANTGATVAAGTVSGGNSFVVPVPTAVSLDSSYTTVTVTIRDAAATVTTQTVRINYALARQGGQGTTGTGGPQGTTGGTGAQGTTGPQGALTRYAYSKLNIGTNFNTSATPVVVSGDNLPTSNSWGQTVTWASSPVTIATNQIMYMVNGIYNPATSQTTWYGPPYLATLKVGQLSAISADLGAITAGSINIGSGKFVVASDGTVTIQNAASGQRLVLTNSLVSVYDSSNVLRVRLGIW